MYRCHLNLIAIAQYAQECRRYVKQSERIQLTVITSLSLSLTLSVSFCLSLPLSVSLSVSLSLQVTLSHGRPRFTFPLPSGIQQSSSVVAVEEDGSIRFQVTKVYRH